MNVQGRSGQLYTLNYPLTCIFQTSSRLQYGINSAHFMIYNLSPATRNDIQFDSAIDIDRDTDNFILPVKFYAGYVSEGPVPLVFQGNIQKSFSYREGPNVVTDIVVADGQAGVQNSQVATSVAGPQDGTQLVNILAPLMAPFGLSLGGIGSIFNSPPQTRGSMLLGSTYDVLAKLAAANNGTVFIDQGKIFLLGPDDYLVAPGFLNRLDATTGLIGTPRRSGYSVDADMIFEPRVRLGQMLTVASDVNPNINGTFRVDAIAHSGIISGAKDGGVVTSFSLFYNAKTMNPVAVL